MAIMDFVKKLSFQRPVMSTQRQCITPYAIQQEFESDRGRIINSAAIRRLQQKTQVFPLERNAFVRSRLTHSMEVQQVGRHIVKEIVNRLQQSHQADYGFIALQNVIESVVEMACLMHDIGNPPFGHFGEQAINNWFSRLLSDVPQIQLMNESLATASSKQLWQKILTELVNFEGNAQAIRLVHTLLKLNLTYVQVAAILKYPLPAYFQGERPQNFKYLTKKVGYYLSEEPFITELRQQLQMDSYCRHPLSYIMEAADDISYCIADLEDAVEKEIMTVEQLYGYLSQEWGVASGSQDKKTFEEIIVHAYVNYQKGERGRDTQFFISLRVNTIRKLVQHAAERFLENIEAIYHGHFDQGLLEGHGVEHKLLECYKSVARKYVFIHRAVEELEMQGYKIISGLLDCYRPLLAIPYAEFVKLEQENTHCRYWMEVRLLHRLPLSYRQAYREAVQALIQRYPVAEVRLLEFYYRCRMLKDHLSGMTDYFAYDEYRQIMVIT